MAELSGLRALVTGGASGIGLAVATLFSHSGCRVAVLDLDRPRPEESVGLVAVTADVCDGDAVRAAVAESVDALGGLDVLVNNAGIGARGRVEDNDDDEWAHVWDVNVMGIVRVTRAALPALLRSPQAAIVNVGSIVASTGLPQRVLYSATKGAVVAMTRAMAADLVATGIRVNAVNPGTVDTPFVDRLLSMAPDPDAERRTMQARQPHGRFVTAEEVAAAVLFLGGPSASSVTGTVLAVDGGMAGLRLPHDPQGRSAAQPDRLA
jgi:NAD(P)-dependent dehydrogenase (short-subunit alcohol dehydrogenase family)